MFRTNNTDRKTRFTEQTDKPQTTNNRLIEEKKKYWRMQICICSLCKLLQEDSIHPLVWDQHVKPVNKCQLLKMPFFVMLN